MDDILSSSNCTVISLNTLWGSESKPVNYKVNHPLNHHGFIARTIFTVNTTKGDRYLYQEAPVKLT